MRVFASATLFLPVVVLVAGSIGGGCASGTTYEEIAPRIPPLEENRGRIVVLKTEGAHWSPVVVNGVDAGKVGKRGFLFIDVPEGPCEVVLRGETPFRRSVPGDRTSILEEAKLQLTVRSGRASYLLISTVETGTWGNPLYTSGAPGLTGIREQPVYSFRLAEVDQAKGEEALRHLRYSGPEALLTPRAR